MQEATGCRRRTVQALLARISFYTAADAQAWNIQKHLTPGSTQLPLAFTGSSSKTMLLTPHILMNAVIIFTFSHSFKSQNLLRITHHHPQRMIQGEVCLQRTSVSDSICYDMVMPFPITSGSKKLRETSSGFFSFVCDGQGLSYNGKWLSLYWLFLSDLLIQHTPKDKDLFIIKFPSLNH